MGRCVLVFAGVLLVACGGQSSSTGQSGSGGTSGLGTGGAVSAGGVGGISGGVGVAGAGGSGVAGGGTGGSAGACQWPGPACVRNCATQGFEQPVCIDGGWQCAGSRYEECPLDSCARDNGECCDRASGHLSASECGADGKRAPCEGSATHIENRAACIPDDLNVTDCEALDGEPCEPGLECSNAGGCRLHCSCVARDAGRVWSCTLPPC